MPSEFSRTRRVGEQIQREIAQLIQLELKDPRLGMVTVSGVEVSRDMAYATVYITVLGEFSDINKTLTILEKASGFLRRELANRLRLRHMPTLRFRYDESISKGNALGSLIEKAVEEDRQHQKQRGEDGEEA